MKDRVAFVVSDFGIGEGCFIVDQLGHCVNCFLLTFFVPLLDLLDAIALYCHHALYVFYI